SGLCQDQDMMPYQPMDTAYSRTPALLEPLPLSARSLIPAFGHPSDTFNITIMGLYLSLSAIHPAVLTVGFLAEFR
ncbi:MAG: hypothetical protein DSO07_02735, partial [Thermoproteota archaeon]